MNVLAWKNLPFIQQRYSASMIDQIERDLRALADTFTSEGKIEWGMRQIAYERRKIAGQMRTSTEYNQAICALRPMSSLRTKRRPIACKAQIAWFACLTRSSIISWI